jgi:hypothetical protein
LSRENLESSEKLLYALLITQISKGDETDFQNCGFFQKSYLESIKTVLGNTVDYSFLKRVPNEAGGTV